MAQGIYDKIINHYVTRYILIPKLEKYLNNKNSATRKGMGTSYAIKLLKKDFESFKKYDKFYFFKLDISKYFYSLDHEVIISIIKQYLTQDELNIVKIILDSTNKEYINKKIEYLEKKYNVILPKYEYKKGLTIGNLSSQFLAILYLSKLQHYITNNLHIKFINYMDDYILIKDKNNNYISFNEDRKIINYFGIKDVNTIYLNNLEIEEKYEYENNKYNELYLKVKIIEILEVLCKKELE